MRAARNSIALLLVLGAIAALSGCGTGVYNARFERAMRVLEHQRQVLAAVDESWSDRDVTNEAGDVIRPSTGVSYRLPRQLQLELDRGDWPALPRFVPREDVLAVFVGNLPKENDQQQVNPLVYCYILAEKAEEPDGASPTPTDQSASGDAAAGAPGLHQRVQTAWEQTFSTFDPAPITQPAQPDFGAQRRFDMLHAPQDSLGPQEDVYLYLFPASVDDRSNVQVAIYFHISDGPAQVTELTNLILLSLETLRAGGGPAPSAGGDAGPVAF